MRTQFHGPGEPGVADVTPGCRTDLGSRKIALVYDAVYPYSIGGAERRFFEIGRKLASQGYDVHLYGMKWWSGPAVIRREGLTLHGLCKSRPLYTKSGRRSIAQALVFGVAAFKLIGEKFDAIDCCGFPYFSMFGCKVAAAVRRRPLCTTWHEVWGKDYWNAYLGRLGPIGFAVERLAARLPDTAIAVSPDTAGRLVRELGFRGRVIVAPNGVDVDAIDRAAVSPRASQVICVGRLVDFKNVDLVIRAVSILRDGGIPVRCVIVGDGPMRSCLEDLVAELDLIDFVHFTGFVEDEVEVYGLMKASEVYVLASGREGFGISVVEALAAGLQVVTVDLPANAARHLVPESQGEVVAADAHRIAEAIERQRELRGRGGVRVPVAVDYDWSAVSESIARVLMPPDAIAVREPSVGEPSAVSEPIDSEPTNASCPVTGGGGNTPGSELRR